MWSTLALLLHRSQLQPSSMSRNFRAAALAAVFVFALCSVFGSLVHTVVAEEAVAGGQSGVKTGLIDDEVRVLYCTSCGFQQNFIEVKKFLEDKYPHLVDQVYGSNYAVDPMKTLLAQALGYAQIAGMVLMVLGEQIFRSLGWNDSLLQKALDNRIACFAVILLLGSVSQGLSSSGAFEVYYNEHLIFSKLQHDRWPTLDELAQLLEAQGLSALY